MKSFLSIFAFVLFSLSIPLFAQSDVATVDSLSNNLFNSSNKYVEFDTVYRVVKWKTLSAYFDEIKALDNRKTNQIQKSAQKIQELQEEKKEQIVSYNALNDKYTQAIKVNDAIAIFSLLIPKNQYNLIMWSLISILIGIIVILYLMYHRSHQLTRNAKKELEEKVEEFEAYRKRTLRREQDVASGYLREIKKLKERLNG